MREGTGREGGYREGGRVQGWREGEGTWRKGRVEGGREGMEGESHSTWLQIFRQRKKVPKGQRWTRSSF